MADLDVIEPIPRLDPIVAIGKDELVEGGLEGAANRPIIALANQVAYVMDRTYSKEDINEKNEEVDLALIRLEAGAWKVYQTLSAANADIANIPLDKKVSVLSLQDGGDYYKESDDATFLTKSPFDQVQKSKEYVDSLATVKAKSIPAMSNLDNYITEGNYFSSTTNAGNGTNFPINEGGCLRVDTTNWFATVQTYISIISGNFYQRFIKADQTWSPWKRIVDETSLANYVGSQFGAKPTITAQLLTNVNLNDHKIEGQFFVASSSATLENNFPVNGLGGSLRVEASNWGALIQCYTTFVGAKVYIRSISASGGAWSNWSQISQNSDLLTVLNDSKAYADSLKSNTDKNIQDLKNIESFLLLGLHQIGEALSYIQTVSLSDLSKVIDERDKDLLMGLHVLGEGMLSNGSGGAVGFGSYKGRFVYGSQYKVGELFDHGSGSYRVLNNVDNALISPDQDSNYEKMNSNASGEGLKAITVSSVSIDVEVERAVIPASISHDGFKLWSHSTNILRESLDGGKTWNDLYSFSNVYFIDWVKELDNGELLLQVILFVYVDGVKVRDRYIIYRTEGKNSGLLTMVECFRIEPESVFASHAWSVSAYKNIVLVGEYGAKYGIKWGDIVVKEGENARYVRMSLDYGKTWKVVFDLNDYVIKDQCHIHGICYDQYWNRVWLTYGDGENGTMYSDDMGETWRFAHHDLEFEGSHQNVGIVALPDCILFATDYHPDGIHRIDRSHGRNTPDGTYPIDIAYFIDVGQTKRNYVGMSICHAKNTEYSPVLFGFVAETANAKSCVIATYNGWDFFPLWMDSLIQPQGKGLEFVCGVTVNNEIIIRSNDSRTTGTGKRTKITLKV